GGGLNVYGFLQNNPVTHIDLLGLTDPQFGAGLSIGLGWDSIKGVFVNNISLFGTASQGLCQNAKLRADINVRLYTGGLGTPTTETGSPGRFQLDITGAFSATIGQGHGAGTPQYTLNYQTHSALDNTFNDSFTLG